MLSDYRNDPTGVMVMKEQVLTFGGDAVVELRPLVKLAAPPASESAVAWLPESRDQLLSALTPIQYEVPRPDSWLDGLTARLQRDLATGVATTMAARHARRESILANRQVAMVYLEDAAGRAVTHPTSGLLAIDGTGHARVLKKIDMPVHRPGSNLTLVVSLGGGQKYRQPWSGTVCVGDVVQLHPA